MAWFRRNRDDDTSSVVQEIAVTPDQGQKKEVRKATRVETDRERDARKFRETPTSSIEQHWNDIIRNVDELFAQNPNLLYYPAQQSVLLEQLRQMKTEYLLIDRKLLDDNESLTMKGLITDRLPSLVGSFANLRISQDSAVENKESRFLWQKDQMRIIHNHILSLSAKIKARSLTSYERREAATELSSLAFPIIPDMQVELPDKLREQLSKISAIWEVEKNNPHSPETMYILDRMATDYIPTSLELYEKFSSASDDLKAKAVEALSSQLSLMEEHLVKIQSEVLNDYLKSLDSQTDFLKQRFKTYPPQVN